MGSSPGWRSSAVVGGLVLLGLSAAAAAQDGPVLVRVAVTPGSIGGSVQDEAGLPVPGALVSAVGVTTAVAYTDRLGRFELRTLAPGPYLVRAQLPGFVTPRGQLVEVRPSARSASSIELRRAPAGAGKKAGQPTPSAPPVLTAAFAPVPESQPAAADLSAAPTPRPDTDGSVGTPDSNRATASSDDAGEMVWRLRYARRGVLKDLTRPGDLNAGQSPVAPGSAFGRPAGDGLSASLLSNMPFTGQVKLLTASSFDSPQDLFSTDTFARSITYMSLVTPAGEHADWSMRGALTQGDISSWFLAGAYTTRTPSTHKYDFGVSYSTQRYDGGNPAALRQLTDGNRNAGTISASDTIALTPDSSLSYGARYARYGYLSGHGLLSPSVGLTIVPADGLRVTARLASTSLAPGAEEFLPPAEDGIWLPPQRTFSSLSSTLQPERTTNMSVVAEHDLDPTATSTISLRVFRQSVTDQMVTMFGVDAADAPNSQLGHYFVGSAGSLDALGWGAGFRTSAFSRIRGSIEYTNTQATWNNAQAAGYLLMLAPLVVRPPADRVQDVSTTIETNVPETATRVLIVCRLSNLHAMNGTDQPMYASRFDVQVRQSLPFMDFSSAKWEMLVGVRNFFRDASLDSSVYDELLVVHPPKRIVGGLTLRF